MRALSIIAMLAALAPCAAAQRATASGRGTAIAHSGSPRSNGGGSFAMARRSSLARRSSRNKSPYAALPFPFLGDSFDLGDNASSGDPGPSGPPPFLMQALSGLAGSATNSMGSAMSAPANSQPSSGPLMIELQNGRYVRVNNNAADGEALPLAAATQKSSAHLLRPESTPSPMIAAAAAPVMPPAVLVFHDGHREEVRDYTIADGTLYARGDYYTDGYWNKKIDLASLNVPQTLQANADRNIKFVLPSSPNEVITRP
jgi:hypothetical protein